MFGLIGSGSAEMDEMQRAKPRIRDFMGAHTG
jgi:hypothetical protein